MSIHMNDTPTAGPHVPGSGYGLGDTIYSAIKRALGDMESGGGGGGAQTTDVYLWNMTEGTELDEVVPVSVKYVSGFDGGRPVLSEISFEPVTETYEGTTVHGIHMSNVPAGAMFRGAASFSWTGTGATLDGFGFDYSLAAFPPSSNASLTCCPMPISGLFVSGSYELIKEG